MRIVLTARDEIGMELSGTFSTDRATAEAIVSRRLAQHEIGADRQLLEWIQSLSESIDYVEISPDSPEEDRMIYVLADLINRQDDIVVQCSKCNASVPLDSITFKEKDFSHEIAGMRVGFAGNLYRCSNQHELLIVPTKIF